MDAFDRRPSRLAALPLALLFLFETWVWLKLAALARYVAALLPWERFRDAARRAMNRLPAIFSVALFGLPLLASEFGAFVSVVMMATGHAVVGMGLYVAMKIFGLALVPVIFEVTRERLLGLPWFAYLYVKFEALHALAHRLVAPYREAALRLSREIAALTREAFGYAPSRSAAHASAAKAEALASSARAVGSSPASPSQ